MVAQNTALYRIRIGVSAIVSADTRVSWYRVSGGIDRKPDIKARFPRRPTLRPPSSLFPQHRASSLLDAWTTSVRHFFPLAIIQPLHCPIVPNFPPFTD